MKRTFLGPLLLGILLLGIGVPNVLFGYPAREVEAEEVQTMPVSDAQSGSVEGLRSLQNSFRSVAAKVLPSVVELKVVEIIKQPVQRQTWPWGFSNPDRQGDQEQEREFKSNGLGSGVIVRRDGDTYYILTNSHVAGDADEIKAVLNDEREFTADLVGKDTRRDLALVKFTSRDEIPVADLGDSDELYVGDWVLAVGSPFGFVSSVTAGIVSAKGRSGPGNNISEFIQTDAAINRGNSGGALVNIDGQVVGINTWIAAPTGGNVGLGFAIPINEARGAIEDFIDKGRVEYGWLGATVTNISEDLAEEMNLDTVQGAFIHDVYIGSPAEQGGILPGDFIIEIDGKPVQDRNSLVRIVGELKPNERSRFTLLRDGESVTATVKIGRREDQEQILTQQNKLWPGIAVATLNDEIRDRLRLSKDLDGVIIASIEEKTKLYIGGLRQYDVITEINGQEIENLADFYRQVNDPDTRKFELGFVREGSTYFIGIQK